MLIDVPDQARTTRVESAGCGPVFHSPRAIAGSIKNQVFECVRSAGQISRSEVAKQLGVSPATMTPLVAGLIDEGFLEESVTAGRTGNRGRPPVALSVRPDAGYVVGLKVSDDAQTGVVINFAGELVADVSRPRLTDSSDPDAMIRDAVALYHCLVAASGIHPDKILALGLGVPGVIDHSNGVMQWSPLLEGRDVPIAARLSAQIDLPVMIDNDANLVTLAELWYGAGRNIPNFAVVTIEHGVGMGLVINHQLYRGTHNAAPELGHTKVQMDGALCRCGQRGCLEAYLADYALVREAAVAMEVEGLAKAGTQVQLEALYAQAKAGNETARTIFRRAGRFLAIGLANVVSLFDPSLIILAGERMRYEYLYEDEVLAEMRRLTVAASRPIPPVEINVWGDLVWARGAATMALSQISSSLTSPEPSVT